MQQVQTSQPGMTWTIMKAIFTGTIRSLANCLKISGNPLVSDRNRDRLFTNLSLQVS
jgi:hypothetical protein